MGDIEVFGRNVMMQASVLVTLDIAMLALAPAAMMCATVPLMANPLRLRRAKAAHERHCAALRLKQ